MIKVVLGCIGKYLDGGGAETVFLENEVFGKNVVKSVLAGSHYERSTKGMLLLSEAIERMQWCSFLNEDGHVGQYESELEVIKALKREIEKKQSQESKDMLTEFVDMSDAMRDDFKDFKEDMCKKSETFAYWDIFVHMTALLRDLIRADREGNWNLHLHTLQQILPLFASCDRTNYLRWASLYLEDMRLLPQTAPEVHASFMAGKFVKSSMTIMEKPSS